jgi:hypothetical protein
MTMLSLYLSAALTGHAAPAGDPGKYELESVQKIWDQGNHNAFTDLIRAKDRWYCTFREGKGHVSPDGALRVLTSADGKAWESSALVRSATADLRDPKLSVTPDGRLMLAAAAVPHKPQGFTHQSVVYFSADGKAWGEPTEVGDPNYWLWRVDWHKGAAYGVGYHCKEPHGTRLYKSADGKAFTPLVEKFRTDGYSNESDLLFLPDDTCLCLLRYDGKAATGRLGAAKPPYTDWTWKDLGQKIGGPALTRLPDGRLVAVVRLYDKKVRTAVCTVDAGKGTLTEVLALPSGGDTSYAGVVWHDGRLWVSYYSSHEGKTAIYLARVRCG